VAVGTSNRIGGRDSSLSLLQHGQTNESQTQFCSLFNAIMLHVRRLCPFVRLTPINVTAKRSRSTRPVAPSMSIDDKHVITETRPVDLDRLSPVVRQLLRNDPSYALRFGAQLSTDRKYLVRQRTRTTGRAEHLFTDIYKDDLVTSNKFDDNDDDLPHPPIVAFPSAENQFQIDLGTEDPTVVRRPLAQCFGCGATLQCANRKEPYVELNGR
jgi:hypothetical protein